MSGHPLDRGETATWHFGIYGMKTHKKGVFITTSGFTSEAVEYTQNIENKIVLISGEQLAAFMFDHNVGVNPGPSYEIKTVDADYFAEE